MLFCGVYDIFLDFRNVYGEKYLTICKKANEVKDNPLSLLARIPHHFVGLGLKGLKGC